MSTALERLMSGQRMTRDEFQDRYQATPDLKFELIGGVVHMASPVGKSNGHWHGRIMTWLGFYAIHTPGVREFDNASAALSESSEVQPDAALLIDPKRGGQSRDLDGMIDGAPEMVVEVADSSRRIDLGAKLRDYERSGVLDYVVLVVEPFEVVWHVRQQGRLVRISPDPDGLYRSSAFPGLWLDPVALMTGDGPALLATLGRGLASPEHTTFVAGLAADPGGGNP